MKVIKSKLPDNSILKTDKETYDYTDSYLGEFIDTNGIGTSEIGKLFFKSSPQWIDKLFLLRNKIVKLSGLKTSGNLSDRQNQLDKFTCEEGDVLGLFRVYRKTTNEVILGEDDKHLNFRISLFITQSAENIEKKTLTISTTVKFNNWFGRLYFLPVRSFHKLIVPAMLKGIIKNIEKKK